MGEDVSSVVEKHAKLIGTLKEVTTSVFETMMGISVTPLDVTANQESSIVNEGIVAMVGMAGAVSGSGSLSLSSKFACFSASRFLMDEFDQVTDEVLDAVSELANMIIGGLKTVLEEQMGPMGLSIPTIVCGEHYITRSPKVGDRMTLRFGCNDDGIDERFSIVVCLIPNSANRSYLKELAEFHAHF